MTKKIKSVVDEDARYLCNQCYGGFVEHKRIKLGYRTCLKCGEYLAKAKKHTIVPMHKSNYMVVTRKEDLIGINNKGGNIK